MAERDEQQSSGCSACDQMGQTPTPEHLAGVARFEAQEQSCSVWAKGGGCTLPKRHDGLHVSPLEAENARLRDRVAALEGAGKHAVSSLANIACVHGEAFDSNEWSAWDSYCGVCAALGPLAAALAGQEQAGEAV